MRISTKPYLTALAAALPLALGVGAASARTLSMSSQTFRVTWSRLEFQNATFGVTVRCPVTLEGSFHSRTLAKTLGSLIGAITAARAKEESCTGGRVHLKNLPWHVTYEGFTGTLPNISGVVFLVSRFRFEVIEPGICTGDYGTTEDNIKARGDRDASGAITRIEYPAGTNVANLVTSLGMCAPTISIVGSEGLMTALNSSARITVTLI